GHVMRCVAFAQAWKGGGGAVTFLVREGLSGIEERIRAEGILLERLPEESGPSPEAFVHAVLCFGSAIAVLDGYGFGAREQAALSRSGIRVLTVDDYGHASAYPARWVLNQNAYAAPEMYTRTNRDTRLLLGPCYAMLREEFLPWMGAESFFETFSKINETGARCAGFGWGGDKACPGWVAGPAVASPAPG